MRALPIFRRDRESRRQAKDAKRFDRIASIVSSIDPPEALVALYPRVPAAWSHLANMYLERNGPDDLDSAVDALRKAVELTRGTAAAAGKMTDLADTLGLRYGRLGDIADLEEAVDGLEQVRAEAGTAPDARMLAMLCHMRHALAARTADFGLLESAIEAGEEAAEAAAAGPERANALGRLAYAHVGAYEMQERAAHLDQALTLYAQAVSEAGERNPAAFDLNTMYTDAARLKYRATQDLADLDRAVRLARTTASEIAPGAGADRGDNGTLALVHLGACLRDRHARLGDPEDLRNGLDALYRALSQGQAVGHLAATFEAARELGDWCGQLADWGAAADAYETGLEVVDLQFAAQKKAVNQRHALGLDVTLPSRAAHAVAMAGDPARALGILERWRAILRDPDAATGEIPPPVGTTPLVYLASCPTSGLAFIARDGRVDHLQLPDLHTDALIGWVERLLEQKEQRGLDRDTWERVLDLTCEWLWDKAMGPVLNALGPVDHAVLIPCGPFALLPLHAAWTSDPSRPTGRRYALDEVLWTYAPNARELQWSHRRAEKTAAEGRLVTVEDPALNDRRPLAYAGFEGQAASSLWHEHLRIRSGQADRSTVMDAIPAADVLHFACHTLPDPADPSSVALALADGELLSIEDVSALRLRARVVVLSACDTGIPNLDLLDEVIGLPGAFLNAGVAGAVSSLWPISDENTMLLMIMLYQQWRREGLGIAHALRQAQQWMRDTTNAEKRATFEEHLDGGGWMPSEVAMACWEQVILQDPLERSTASPASWAAFTFTGA
ncbi:CHAT domain-containing protein [Actinomadura scrupuli]|uniref:CHAT domain-containing protein n=1 Tax=Actinomadura scrupuli TaxID=559629 RepID=UPI003D95655B